MCLASPFAIHIQRDAKAAAEYDGLSFNAELFKISNLLGDITRKISQECGSSPLPKFFLDLSDKNRVFSQMRLGEDILKSSNSFLIFVVMR